MARNNSEVAHLWASGAPDAKGSNLYFEGPKIYSYGKHFCIARMLPNGVVVMGMHTASVTTAKHQSYVRRAVSHKHIVYCYDPDADCTTNMASARNEVATLLEAAQAPRIRDTTRVAKRAEALRAATQANAYRAMMQAIGEDQGEEPIDTTNLEGVREEMKRIEEERERQAALEKVRKAAELKQALDRWCAGEDVRRNFYDIDPCLRLSKTDLMVETSHGAEIPVSHARRLWPVIQQVRAGGQVLGGMQMRLGHYVLNTINADGSIVVGCHNIAYSEIEKIAKQLGLLEEEAA